MNDEPKIKTGTSIVRIMIFVMVLVFIVNLILSRDYNVLMVALTGGGRIVDFLGASYPDVYLGLQLHRLVTYGYVQPAIWHLLANGYALSYIGPYFESVLGRKRFLIVFHVGLIIAGAVYLVIFPDDYMYGASPAVFCCLGMLANWLFKDRSLLNEYKAQRGWIYLLCYMILSNFLGTRTFAIHLLGFLTGLLLGAFVKREDKKQDDGMLTF
jgi:rhomboid protease GluP